MPLPAAAARSPRIAPMLVTLCGVMAILVGPSPAWAVEDECSPTVEIDAGLLATWPTPRAEVDRLLATQQSLEPCAHVTLRRTQPGITIAVRLRDGRATERTVTSEQDVVPALTALLLLPEDLHVSQRAQRAVVRDTRGSTRNPSTTEPTIERSVAGSTAEAPASWGLEMSLFTAAAAGNGQVSLGAGALALLERHGWSLGFQARADAFDSPDHTYATLGVMGVLGRRWRWEAVTLDALSGPALVILSSAIEEQGPEGVMRASTSRPAARWAAGGHLTFAPSWALRPFVGVQGDVGATGVAEGELAARLPRLPVWTLGLALGATVGTR